jgi:ribosomal protein L29
MKKKEFTQKNIDELKSLRQEKQQALRTFRFNIAGSQIRNVKEGKALRKDIARINTELTARATA